MVTLVGISGSLRKGSYNTALLRAALSLAPEGVTFREATIAGIPLYNADEERSGVPEPVSELRAAIANADGVILFTPEYNNAMPGVFKNAIDWASSSGSGGTKVFAGKIFALAGASPGPFGTLLSQNAWLPVFRTLGSDLWAGKRLMLPTAAAAFDADGQMVDEEAKARLATFVAAFVDYVRERTKG